MTRGRGREALVVGDGVAGITAATWLQRYDASFRWFGGRWGGILNEVHNPIIDLPGANYPNGLALVDQLRQWATALPAPEQRCVSSIQKVGDAFIVTSDDAEFTFSQVIVCTGTARRKLGVPGEAEALGDWLTMSTARNPEQFAGRRVLVVGGADAGVEGALNALDAGAAHVTLLSRSALRGQRQFIDRMLHEPNVTWWPRRATPTRFEGGRGGEAHRVHLDNGEVIEVDVAVVRIGVVPLLPEISPAPTIDNAGFLVVDDRGQSSVPGLFAAGDVTSTPLRSIATSMGDATRAARTVAESQGIWSQHE